MVYHSLHQFCAVELSATYLDISKDRLYVLRPKDPARRSTQSTLYDLLRTLTKLMAPLLSFTAEEIWGHIPGAPVEAPSVFLTQFPEPMAGFPEAAVVEKWEFLLQIRAEVNRALEQARQERLIGNSLTAAVTLGASGELYHKLQPWQPELFFLTMVSQLDLQEGPVAGLAGQLFPDLTIAVTPARGAKCDRCWYYSPSVGEDLAQPQLCDRCRKILAAGAPRE